MLSLVRQTNERYTAGQGITRRTGGIVAPGLLLVGPRLRNRCATETGAVDSSTGSQLVSSAARYEGRYKMARHLPSFLSLVRRFGFQVRLLTHWLLINGTLSKTGRSDCELGMVLS